MLLSDCTSCGKGYTELDGRDQLLRSGESLKPDRIFMTERTDMARGSSVNAFRAEKDRLWTEEEKKKFIEGVRFFGNDMEKVSEYVGSRNVN